MADIHSVPDTSNFFSTLFNVFPNQIIQIFESIGWKVHHSDYSDFSVECEWGELVVEDFALQPEDGKEHITLMHGPIADILTNGKQIIQLLDKHSIKYTVEFYGEYGNLLLERKSDT